MPRYAVWIEQVNQERIVVGAKDQLHAQRQAVKIWRSDCLCPLIIDVMLLPEEKE